MEPYMRLCELRQKEVINCKDGERLGFIGDIVINCVNGCVEKVIVPGPCKLWGFLGRESEYVIPWKNICQIGTDVILVEIDAEKALQKIPNLDCD